MARFVAWIACPQAHVDRSKPVENIGAKRPGCRAPFDLKTGVWHACVTRPGVPRKRLLYRAACSRLTPRSGRPGAAGNEDAACTTVAVAGCAHPARSRLVGLVSPVRRGNVPLCGDLRAATGRR